MGKVTTIKYEITKEIKELQQLSLAVKPIGYEVNIDITQDLVTINGFRKMSRANAKLYMEEILSNASTAMTTSDFPDPEVVAREQRQAEKKARKHREPGAPPELRTLIRRAKRIYKKTLIKFPGQAATAMVRAKSYLEKKSPDAETNGAADQALLNWVSKKNS